MSKTAEEFAEVLCDCAQAEDEVRGHLRWCMAIDGVAMVEQALAQARAEADRTIEEQAKTIKGLNESVQRLTSELGDTALERTLALAKCASKDEEIARLRDALREIGDMMGNARDDSMNLFRAVNKARDTIVEEDLCSKARDDSDTKKGGE